MLHEVTASDLILPLSVVHTTLPSAGQQSDSPPDSQYVWEQRFEDNIFVIGSELIKYSGRCFKRSRESLRVINGRRNPGWNVPPSQIVFVSLNIDFISAAAGRTKSERHVSIAVSILNSADYERNNEQEKLFLTEGAAMQKNQRA